MNFKLASLLLWLLIGSCIFANAQNQELDSLDNLLQQHKSDDTIKANLLNKAAYKYWNIDIDKTLQYANEAIELSEKLDFQKGKAEGLKNVGLYFWLKSLYPTALDYYQKSLRISQEIGNELLIAKGLGNVGIIYKEEGEYAKALEYYKQSLEIYEQLDDKYGISRSYNNLGGVYELLGNYTMAIKHYQKSFQMDEQLGNKSGMAISLANIAIIYEYQGNYEKALDYNFRSLELKEDIDNQYGVCISYTQIGSVYQKQKDYSKALAYNLKALEIANEIQPLDRLKEIHSQLAQVYAATQNFKKAYEHYRDYKRYSDSVFNKANIKKITILEYHHKYEKEKELATAQQAQKEKRQRIIRNAFIFGFVLALLLVGLVYRNYLIKRKANKLLTEQKNEIEEKNAELYSLNEEVNVQKEALLRQAEELKKYNEDLNKKNKQLQDLNHEQNSVMRIVAHDLKSPLNNIFSILQMLEENKEELSKEEKEYYQMIYKVVEGGRSLIKDLTDIHQAEELQSEMKCEKTEVEGFVEEIINLQRKKAESKDIKIHYTAKLLYLERNIEQDFLRRIIENLLSNAIKFSPFSKNIYVDLTDSQDEIKISVKDEGPGFSDKDKKKAFKKFQRLSARPTNNEHSSGLGLSIVKALVERQNGSIELVSEEGKGAEFVVTIPGEPIEVK
jgi:signal transduction histidine kinase